MAFLTDASTINSDYRVRLPADELGRRGHEVQVNPSGAEGRFGATESERFDVVWVHRYADGEVQRLVRRLQAGGVAVVWDDDDDLAAPRPAMQRGGLKRQATLALRAQMLALADVVTAPSPALAERFRREGAGEVEVVENYVRNDFPHARRMSGRDQIVIGWSAAREHVHDVDPLALREALSSLLDRHGEVEVASIGVNLRLRSPRYRHTQWVDFPRLAAAVAEFDVGLAPIADTAFNEARSNLKVKEYAALGIPWLASPIGPYAGLGEKQGGRLVADACWEQELERIVSDARLRRKLAKRAARWGARETIARNVDRWEAVLERARERAASRR